VETPVNVLRTDVRERIVALLVQAADAQGVRLPSEGESLFDSGVLDSFGLLEFITTVEEEFNIRIPEDDLVPSNFETIARICSYVTGKLGR